MIENAFPKLIELDELSKYGEPTIQIVRPHEFNKLAHVKTASEAVDYIKNVKPMPGKTIILVLAMTAGEFYGQNRNGDAWPERPVRHGKINITEDEVLPKHYKTFESIANVFSHHINKDPEKRIGQVVKAFYNWPMHRVELLLALDNRQAEDAVQEIESGKFPAVSMGCFTAETLVTMGDGTRKPIELISVGDRVRTHLGNIKEVIQVHKRPYRGQIYRVKPAVYPAIECTEEHPFWAIQHNDVRKKDDKATFRWDPTAQPKGDWVHAKCLTDETYLVEPIDTTVATPDFVTRAFARLFGYYLAEGCVIRGRNKNPVAVQLSVNRKDTVVEEIGSLCQEYGTRNAPNIYPSSCSDEALVIDIYDNEFAQLCLEHGGGFARHKRLSQSALHWHPDMQQEFIGAYANGDGCGTAKGELKLSTASTNLAWQLVSVLHRLGITPSIQNIEHKAGSGYSNKNTFEWVIHIGKQWAQQLRNVCQKVKPVNILAYRNDRMIFGNSIITPIREITSEFTDTEVYNIEVADDESYIAGGMAVHNCKVKFDVCSLPSCGNKAPSRKEYCDHAKYQLGDTLSNGQRIFVWNPSPKFFDISIVRRPADRLGFMMKKVAEYAPEIRSGAELGEYVAEASRKVANLRKLSLIQKVLNGSVPAAKTDDGTVHEVKQFNDSVAAPAAASMPPLDDAAIRQLIAYRPAEVLSTLASMGILLTTPEFIKYFVWKFAPNIDIPEEYLDRAVAAQHQVFSALAENPELLDSMEATGCLELSPENVNQALAEKMSSWVEKRSQHRDWIVKRAMFGLRQTTRDPTTGYTPGDFDLVSVRDPNTGKAYQTTKSVARRTEGLARKHQLGQILGGGALFAGGLALAPLRGLSGLAPLVGLSGVRRLAKARKGYPHIHAETGERVYLPSEALGRTIFPGTEMTEKQSSDVEFGMSDAVIKMAMEFAHRPQARNKKVAAIVLDEGGNNFDAAALKVGDAICL